VKIRPVRRATICDDLTRIRLWKTRNPIYPIITKLTLPLMVVWIQYAIRMAIHNNLISITLCKMNRNLKDSMISKPTLLVILGRIQIARRITILDVVTRI
jgi:hypothetical protein